MSLTEQSSARLTALTSGNGSGTLHATRLLPRGAPLKRVWTVARHQQEIGEFGRDADAAPQQFRGRTRTRQHFEREAPEIARNLQAAIDGFRHRREQAMAMRIAVRAKSPPSPCRGACGVSSVIDSKTATNAMPSAMA